MEGRKLHCRDKLSLVLVNTIKMETYMTVIDN